jgi:FeS assembly protein IscX
MATPPQLRWDDAEDIALALADKFPDLNPLEVRFTDLHMWITGLPMFVDNADQSSEGKLEAIQMAWYEEWQDRRKQAS